MFGLDDILGAVTGVAGLVGAAGKGEGSGPTQINGFQSLPKNIQDLLQGPILNQVTTQLNKPYTTVPTRRANASDYDPVFGSQSVQNLQSYYDQRAAGAKDVTPSAPALPAPNNVTPAGNSFSNPSGGTYQNYKTGSLTQPYITSSDPGIGDYTKDLASAYTNGTPLPSTTGYLGNNQSGGINGLTSSDMAKLKQILAGMGGNSGGTFASPNNPIAAVGV